MLNNQYPIAEIQQIINAQGQIKHPAKVSNLLTDSRKINNPAASLFFALAGRRDGHEFIPQVYKAGVHNFVVSKLPAKAESMPNANFLVVDDVLKALQVLAAHQHTS